MDQTKIGKNLQELREEKGLTQEQLAEHLGVSRRTVSRWETGSNLPDLDLLIELSDYYETDLRLLLDGEKDKKKMDREMEETVLKVAEYSNEKTRRSTVTVRIYFAAGIVALFTNALINLLELPDTFWVGFAKGLTFSLALGAMILGIMYTTGAMTRIEAFKMRLSGKGKEE